MKIGYVTEHDPFNDRRAWSGTIYKIREAIELAGYEVKWIPYHDDWLSKLYENRVLRLKERLTKKKYFRGVHSKFIVKRYAKSIDRNLLQDCDYLFFPGGAQVSLFLKTRIPIIYYADATVHSMIDYYWCGYHEQSIAEAKLLEERACQLSSIVFKSSEWSLKSTIRDCHADAHKCFVIKFGYNIDKKDVVPINPYKKGRLEIFFSGTDWERKGGDFAVEVTKLLRAKGIDAHITICGPRQLPEEVKTLNYVTYLGFYDKNIAKDYYRYIEVWKKTHIFLLPTKAECAGIVFCEAAAYGIPVYTFDTGGTVDYVIRDYNGYTFPLTSSTEDFAQKIADDIEQDRFREYHDNALRLSKEILSWEAFSVRFRNLLKDFAVK